MTRIKSGCLFKIVFSQMYLIEQQFTKEKSQNVKSASNLSIKRKIAENISTIDYNLFNF